MPVFSLSAVWRAACKIKRFNFTGYLLFGEGGSYGAISNLLVGFQLEEFLLFARNPRLPITFALDHVQLPILAGLRSVPFLPLARDVLICSCFSVRESSGSSSTHSREIYKPGLHPRAIMYASAVQTVTLVYSINIQSTFRLKLQLLKTKIISSGRSFIET